MACFKVCKEVQGLMDPNDVSSHSKTHTVVSRTHPDAVINRLKETNR